MEFVYHKPTYKIVMTADLLSDALPHELVMPDLPGEWEYFPLESGLLVPNALAPKCFGYTNASTVKTWQLGSIAKAFGVPMPLVAPAIEWGKPVPMRDIMAECGLHDLRQLARQSIDDICTRIRGVW